MTDQFKKLFETVDHSNFDFVFVKFNKNGETRVYHPLDWRKETESHFIICKLWHKVLITLLLPYVVYFDQLSGAAVGGGGGQI